MTALWLKKMSYHCYVVNESPKKINKLNLKFEENFKTIPLNLINLENFKNLKDTHIFDIRNSVDYCKKRIKKSVWTNRLIITKEISHYVKSMILVTNDLPKASLIVSDLQEKDPEYVVQVYHWNEKTLNIIWIILIQQKLSWIKNLLILIFIHTFVIKETKNMQKLLKMGNGFNKKHG